LLGSGKVASIISARSVIDQSLSLIPAATAGESRPPRRDPHDVDRVADHVGGALLAFGASGHCSTSGLAYNMTAMEHKGVPYTIRVRIERGTWLVTVHPPGEKAQDLGATA
jgi:hypothetical protein